MQTGTWLLQVQHLFIVDRHHQPRTAAMACCPILFGSFVTMPIEACRGRGV